MPRRAMGTAAGEADGVVAGEGTAGVMVPTVHIITPAMATRVGAGNTRLWDRAAFGRAHIRTIELRLTAQSVWLNPALCA